MSGGGLVVALLMVAGLVGLVFYQGVTTFWPGAVVHITTREGDVIVGEVTRSDSYRPEPDLGTTLSGPAYQAFTQEMETHDGWLERRLVRTGNFELTSEHFRWVEDYRIPADGETTPEWMILLERMAWGLSLIHISEPTRLC